MLQTSLQALWLLHPDLQAPYCKMRMLWGLGKYSSSFDMSVKEVATWLIPLKERDKSSLIAG